MEESRMRINELVEKTGIPRTTIHFYIREGLLHPPQKTGQTMGYYDATHVERLGNIKKRKVAFIEATGRTRMPLELLKQQLSEEDPSITMDNVKRDSKVKNKELREKRKREIMEAALRLYADHGYYQTGVRDIALEAGISPAAFYLYFKDKRELFFELIEDVIANVMKETGEVVDRAGDPFSKAVILFYAFHQSYARVGEILNQLRAGIAINDPWAKERFKKIYDELNERTASIIRDYIEQGLIRDVDPDLLAYAFTVLAEAAYQRAAVEERYSLEQVGMMVFDWLVNGVLKR